MERRQSLIPPSASLTPQITAVMEITTMDSSSGPAPGYYVQLVRTTWTPSVYQTFTTRDTQWLQLQT